MTCTGCFVSATGNVSATYGPSGLFTFTMGTSATESGICSGVGPSGSCSGIIPCEYDAIGYITAPTGWVVKYFVDDVLITGPELTVLNIPIGKAYILLKKNIKIPCGDSSTFYAFVTRDENSGVVIDGTIIVYCSACG